MPPHAHNWQFNAEGDQTPEQFGGLLKTIGAQLEAGRRVSLKGLQEELPARVHGVVRKERTPHGRDILKLQVEWSNGNTGGASSSIDDLFDA